MSRLDDREKTVEKLRREHLKLDGQLQELESKKWVSAAEAAEIRRLKKLKLAAKDEMQALQQEA